MFSIETKSKLISNYNINRYLQLYIFCVKLVGFFNYKYRSFTPIFTLFVKIILILFALFLLHTLKKQPYRHVDNIMFENGEMVNRFLNYWRKSGQQRAGLLYGRYEAYDGVPLGIRAVVSAIYEPPQVNAQLTFNR
jgi:hypothetical protein